MGDSVGGIVQRLDLESCPKIDEEGVKYLAKFS